MEDEVFLATGSRVFNGWKISRAVRAIALAPRILRVLRQLYGRKPLPFQTLNFPIGTEQKVHSDVIHFASDPPTYMCGVWVALEDIDRGVRAVHDEFFANAPAKVAGTRR